MCGFQSFLKPCDTLQHTEIIEIMTSVLNLPSDPLELQCLLLHVYKGFSFKLLSSIDIVTNILSSM